MMLTLRWWMSCLTFLFTFALVCEARAEPILSQSISVVANSGPSWVPEGQTGENFFTVSTNDPDFRVLPASAAFSVKFVSGDSYDYLAVTRTFINNNLNDQCIFNSAGYFNIGAGCKIYYSYDADPSPDFEFLFGENVDHGLNNIILTVQVTQAVGSAFYNTGSTQIDVRDDGYVAPEPSSVAVFGVSLVGLCAIRRRYKMYKSS